MEEYYRINQESRKDTDLKIVLVGVRVTSDKLP